MNSGKLLFLSFLLGVIVTSANAGKLDDELLAGLVICIDPGHPSETSAGTRGKVVTENHINWVIACKLAKKLEKVGAAVILTKDFENEKVTNRRRAEIANGNSANLLLRLHCDAGNKSGFRIFYPDRQGKRFGVLGPAKEVIKKSKKAAAVFIPAMKKALFPKLASLGVTGDSETFVGKRQGALTGSIFSSVPVITVEMCVLTNPKDEAFINSHRGKKLMVEALYAGCCRVLAKAKK